ncbi:hypothetical protein R69658_07277 [Paraburkholderia aspalathi]|uniref:NHLP leader peptide domain-containing protein n=1 Tax=Paraburkholderia aspalathi TaxID=1324617 RepID=A0ABN7N5C6_9BURK|nr:NHLP leader peptide family RiPP precursor [Paraburkholderia aspalathi]MBK3823603.1 NHLP leader peptide family natural product precursor [Paraburkholderia aspalathi]MBK3835440.1 NHLP leader peptide family natural product precursor [Paraburkholderia aspalathi]MBK3865200.1 NHLP leader peptide family natural product precursor [Paraburkholderia aspalathi]CAE6853485.1 hypothetical protein R69658_07277 [Paraburkholderia aspalathi]
MPETDRNELIRRSINERVLRRASEDEEFRRLLIDNPKSAIARELGIDIPDDVHVTVIRETADQLFVIVPWTSADSDGQVLSGIERLVSRVGSGYSMAYTPNVKS